MEIDEIYKQLENGFDSEYLEKHVNIDIVLCFYDIIIKNSINENIIKINNDRLKRCFNGTSFKIFDDTFYSFIETFHKLNKKYTLLDYGSHKMVFACKNPKYVFKLYKTEKRLLKEKFVYQQTPKNIVPKVKFISPNISIVERAIPFCYVSLNTTQLYFGDQDCGQIDVPGGPINPERKEVDNYLKKNYKDISTDFSINNFGMLRGKPVILDIDMIKNQ